MTFLIFLASLVVLEYMLRPKPDKRADRAVQERLGGGEPPAEDMPGEAATSGALQSLSAALDSLGRGRQPDGDTAPSQTRAGTP